MPATPEFFSTVRELCDETGALMMVDEVQVPHPAVALSYIPRGAFENMILKSGVGCTLIVSRRSLEPRDFAKHYRAIGFPPVGLFFGPLPHTSKPN